MAKRTRFSEYHDRYANYRFELTDDGILFMQCHTNGGSLVWDWRAHDQLSDAFADIAGDREIKVLIHTGTGGNYNANWVAGDRRLAHLRDRHVLRTAVECDRTPGAGVGGRQHDRVRDAGREHHRSDALGAKDAGAEHLPPQRSGAAHPPIPHGHP
jgi:hypothetical protein